MCQHTLEDPEFTAQRNLSDFLSTPVRPWYVILQFFTFSPKQMRIVRVTRKLLGPEEDDNVPTIVLSFTHSFLFPSMSTPYVMHNLKCRILRTTYTIFAVCKMTIIYGSYI